MADLTILQKPFTDIKSREGDGGKRFAYIPVADVLDRIIEATSGIYDWEIIDMKLIEGQARANKKTGEVKSVWMVHGRLTMPGLGSRDGVGTAVADSEESPKSAESDAYKRACVKFGVGLHLYQDDAHTAAAAPAGGGAVMNSTGSQCPYCNCPAGKNHLRSCPTLRA